MAKYTTDQMKAMIKAQKEAYAKEEKERKEKDEAKKLKKELRELKYKRIKGKTGKAVSGIKKFGGTLGRLADNIEVQNAGVGVGSRVEITNGGYKGTKAKILALIPGGITCMAGSQKVNIRHGSYRKV